MLSLETGELVLKDLAFQWPPGDKFYKGKIISHGCKGSWGRGGMTTNWKFLYGIDLNVLNLIVVIHNSESAKNSTY